jgi:hypothetical protein
LLDFDVEYYGTIHDLKGKAAAVDQSSLKGVTERRGDCKVEFLGYMAPIAFVFALSAISQVSTLKKEIEQLKRDIEKLKS